MNADRIVALIPKGKPYVYALSDPFSGDVFYVGKGRNRRLLAHEKEARGLSGSPKCRRIREIWNAGGHVQYQILSIHETDDEAYTTEAAEIRARGGLTNGMLGRLDPLEVITNLAIRLKPWHVWLAEKDRPEKVVQVAKDVYQAILGTYFDLVFRPHSKADLLGKAEFVSRG